MTQVVNNANGNPANAPEVNEQQNGTARADLNRPNSADELKEITLFWKNLTYRIPDKNSTKEQKEMKTIVQNLTGVAKPRELIGLLGPSGAGKTVLFNIFSDRLNLVKGSEYERNVFINRNVPLTRGLFGKKCAYVMQDDVLLETLTPYECFKFSANLRLSCSDEEKEKAVIKVIEDLRLQTCRDTLVGSVLKKGISGGERRRSSIGVELVTDPPLIVLDGLLFSLPLELTSGLDSFTAYTIVKVLKDLAARGKTIMAIVHQPSTDIFNLFDRAYILANGREVYQGETGQICDYFKMIGKEIPPYTNPADKIIVMMHSKENPDPEDIQRQNELFDSYDKHIRLALEDEIPKLAAAAPEVDEKALKEFQAGGFCLEFRNLFIRAFKNLSRNRLATWVNFIQVLVIAGISDILFWQKGGYDYVNVREKTGAMIGACTYHFLHSINTVLLTCIYSVLYLVPSERKLFLREQSNRLYGVLPYYLSKMLVDLPIQILIPIIFSVMTYWAVELRNEAGAFFQFTAAILILALVGNSIGILLGSMFADFRTSVGIVPVLISRNP